MWPVVGVVVRQVVDSPIEVDDKDFNGWEYNDREKLFNEVGEKGRWEKGGEREEADKEKRAAPNKREELLLRWVIPDYSYNKF